MSSQSSAVIFIFVLAIGVAAFRAEDARGPLSSPATQGSRRIASLAQSSQPIAIVTSKKSKKDFDHTREIHRHTHKLSGPLSSEILIVGDSPEPGDIFVLRGVISASASSENISYKWIIPDGVELVNGEVSSVIEALGPGEQREIQLTLRQISAENSQVHLMIQGGSQGLNYGQTAQYNTLLQKSIEEGHKELLESTEKHAAENQQKIFH